MNKIFLCFFVVLISATGVFSQALRDKSSADLHFYADVKRWFDGWDLVSRQIFKIKSSTRVEFVFF